MLKVEGRQPIFPVIMCGGAGTRLWPASRTESPKQFIRLLGGLSSFQETVLRVALEGAEAPVIIAGVGHAALIEAQLEEIGVAATLILEPEARDSAAAMAAAALWIASRHEHAIAVVVASDHFVSDPGAFREAASLAAVGAGEGGIVTFGVKPTEPSSAYGYIRMGESGQGPVREVLAFVEKPDAGLAREYVALGYLWNSGNFVVAAATLIQELRAHAPDVIAACADALEGARLEGGRITLGPAFHRAPKISIDYAVMEKTDRAMVLPVSFGWSDLGAWDAIHALADKDADLNAAHGRAVLIKAESCLVRAAPGITVAAVGVSNLAIIAEAGSVLVCHLSHSQLVKAAVEGVRAHGAHIPPSPSPREARDRLTTWLSASALPLWSTLGADHTLGGFVEAIGQDGRPVAANRRARVQARQAYVFAAAGLAGWPGPWRAAMDHGLAFFDAHYPRADGLYRTLVAADGAVLDDTATLYDQAFALLAMATAFAADPARTHLPAKAEALLTAIQSGLRHPAGGYREAGDLPFQSNPHMHLFEAALAWIEAGGGACWEALAAEITDLAATRFFDGEIGALREFFSADWSPAAGDAGRIVEPGHQFEWSWLLKRRAEAVGRGDLETLARRLYESGRRGVNAHGVTIDALRDDGSVLRPTARLWPQTERLKAALRLGRAESGAARTAYLADAASAAGALARYLDVPVPGLWRDKLDPAAGFVDEPAPASSLYHIAVAIQELDETLKALTTKSAA